MPGEVLLFRLEATSSAPGFSLVRSEGDAGLNRGFANTLDHRGERLPGEAVNEVGSARIRWRWPVQLMVVRLTRWVGLILPLVSLIAQNNGARVRLAEDWQLDVPRWVRPGLPHPVVCPDGTLYLANTDGRIMSVTRQGRVSSDSYQTVFNKVTALACDAQGKLYIATPDFLGVVEQKSTGDYEVVSTSHMKISAFAIVAAGGDRIFLAGRRNGSPFPLHLITTGGRIIRSFGEIGQFMFDGGFLLWDVRCRCLLMAPQTLAEIQFFEGNGDDITVMALGPYQPMMPHWSGEWMDEVWGMALGPNSGIIIQGRSSLSPPVHAGFCLDFLDRNLNRLVSGLRVDYGILVGSDRNGGLYFLSNKRVTRARVTASESHVGR